MIVRSDKAYEMNSYFPTTNWYESETDNIIIPDNSELAEKIKQYAPYFEWVEDENGNKIDITPTERPSEPEPEPQPPTQLELLQQQVDELTLLLGDALLAGGV